MVTAILVLACFVAVAVGFLRVRRGPSPWTPLDAGICLWLMVWLGGVASGVIFIWAGDGTPLDLDDVNGALTDTQVLLAVLAASLFGTGSATVFARLRAGRGTLGFDLQRPIWLLWAVGLVLPLFLVWFVWGWLLEWMGVEVAPQILVTLLLNEPPSVGLALVVVYVVAVVPVLEEVVFRGFVQAPFVRLWGPGVGIAVSSTLFAVAHLSDPQAVLPLLVLAILLGWLRERTGSLAAPAALHVANNAAAMVVTFYV